MNVIKSVRATTAALAMMVVCHGAMAVPFADVFVGSNGTSFGTGNVLGGPDGSGIFLGNPPAGQFLTVGFSAAIFDGPGIDLAIYDIESFSPDPAEGADVYVSADNILYTLVGSITGGNSLADTSIDIAGAFAGPISFVRLVQSAGTSDAIDIDAIEAFHLAPAVPEPGTLLLMSAGLLLGGRLRTNRRGR